MNLRERTIANRMLEINAPLIYLIALFLVAGGGVFANPCAAAEKKSEVVSFNVSALPELRRHLDLFAYPPYLALALENCGVKISKSQPLGIVDRNSVKIGNASVRFLSRKGSVFSYDVVLQVPTGVTQVDVRLPTEIDATGIDSGTLVIRVRPPMMNLITKALMDRVGQKISASANSQSRMQSQKVLVAYLDVLAGKGTPPGKLDATMEAIMIDAYNRISTTPSGYMPDKDVGEAEPLSDQMMLLATLFIWVVIVPLGIAIARLRRRKSRVQLPESSPR